MKNYLIFAGTVEGRELAEYIADKKSDTIATICTATEYGGELLPKSKNLNIISKRLNENDIENLIKNDNFDAVIDATHPYAVIVSENIKEACNNLNISYYRIVRSEQEYDEYKNVLHFSSIDEALAFLKSTEGNILLTTGSKELHKFCELENYKDRVYARIIPNPDMTKHCFDLGFQGRHLMCMQGPFSEEINIALIHQFDIKYMVTKSSGKAGGFTEKLNACLKTNTKLLVIDRPYLENGFTLNEILDII